MRASDVPRLAGAAFLDPGHPRAARRPFLGAGVAPLRVCRPAPSLARPDDRLTAHDADAGETDHDARR